jgi:hypothetical protein
MARKTESQSRGLGRLQSAANAVKKLFTRGRGDAGTSSPVAAQGSSQRTGSTGTGSTATPGRTVRRETDIPMDVLNRAYTPSATSSKTSFRSDGADHQSDQEFAMGVSDERWNDEDRMTNKSGDPRIGTHRRTYEPAESRTGSRE